MALNLTDVQQMTPTQTLPLVPVFRDAGHVIGETPEEQHSFVIERLTQLVKEQP